MDIVLPNLTVRIKIYISRHFINGLGFMLDLKICSICQMALAISILQLGAFSSPPKKKVTYMLLCVKSQSLFRLAASLERVKDLFASFDFYKSIVCSISSIKC